MMVKKVNQQGLEDYLLEVELPYELSCLYVGRFAVRSVCRSAGVSVMISYLLFIKYIKCFE